MSVQTVALFVIFIPCAWGIFDGRDDGGPRRGDQYPVTGELLQCHDAEPGVALIVGVTGNPGEVFKPTVSRYRYPASLENLAEILTAVASIVNQLNISQDSQSIMEPNFTQIFGFPMRYDPGHPDMAAVQAICGADVFDRLADSDRNADQPHFLDITEMLLNDWLDIWNVTSPGRQVQIANSLSLTPDLYESAWRSDTNQMFANMIQALTCKVAFRWQDAGPTYLPRYFRGGFCLNRNCSLPDRDEFRCHADLSEEAVRLLEAARWDCCWTYTEQDGYIYQCGFRKVQFPIICDCDCRCMDKAGI